MAQELMLVDAPGQAAVMMKPFRMKILGEMGVARSCPQLADKLGTTPQKIYYHVKTMERAGLVVRDGERMVNGIPEGFYRARARSFWLSPRLTGELGGGRRARDATSLGVLAGHAEEMLEEVGRLGERTETGEHVPSLSLSVEIDLPGGKRRAQFLTELQRTFEQLAARYAGEGRGESDRTEKFRFTIACYPRTTEDR